MKEVEIFNFKGNNVRTMHIENEPYFVGKDVTDILQYSNSRDAIIKHVDSEDKGVANCDTPGGKQKLSVINESGLYSLILSSKLPTAKEFKRWVTSEVLPSIRKNGAYLTDQKIEEVLDDPDTIIKLATKLKEERKGRLLAEQQVNELQPKASYYDLVLQSKTLLSVSKIAKDFGMSAKGLNKKLHELGIQFKQGDIWLLYSKYQDKGYTQTSTYVLNESNSRVSTKWTQKGRLFIYELLKSNGILPLIEQDNEKTA